MRTKLLILISLFSAQIFAQKYDDFCKSVFVHNGDSLFYRVAFPDNLEKGKKYPLVVYLHGIGSRGSDNWRQLIHGHKFLKNKDLYNKYPAIVLFPQCPKTKMWTHRQKKNVNGKWEFNFPIKEKPSLATEMTNMLVNKYLQQSYIDSSRVYLVGMSMGGMGVLEFLYRWSGTYSAAAVVCGAHDSKLAQNYCDVPIWFFHGDKDRTVPYKYSMQIYENVKNCNKNSKYTLYKNVAHNCWDSAYSNPDLLKWLYQFSK